MGSRRTGNENGRFGVLGFWKQTITWNIHGDGQSKGGFCDLGWLESYISVGSERLGEAVSLPPIPDGHELVPEEYKGKIQQGWLWAYKGGSVWAPTSWAEKLDRKTLHYNAYARPVKISLDTKSEPG